MKGERRKRYYYYMNGMYETPMWMALIVAFVCGGLPILIAIGVFIL